MKLFRFAVLPFAFAQMQDFNAKALLENEYKELFFSQTFEQSVSRYWMKQSNNHVLIYGDVYSLKIITEEIVEITNRKAAIDYAIKFMEENEEVDFSSYDVIVLATLVSVNIPSDAGSTTAKTKNGSMRCT